MTPPTSTDASTSQNPKPTVCIVGAGNASQAFIAHFSRAGYEVTVLAGFQDEAARLNEAMKENGGITVVDRNDPDDIVEYTARPELVSKDASQVIPQADVILMPLPSFAFRGVFEDIRPHLKKGATIFGMPGQGGLDYVARQELEDAIVEHEVTVAGVIPMPLNCRIIEFGKKVDLAAFKDAYDLATVPAERAPKAAQVLSDLLSRPVRPLGHFAAMTLHAANPNIHPGRLYGLFSDFTEGKVYPENPLFYETFDDVSGQWCGRISDERIAIWNELVRRTEGKVGARDEVPDLKSYIESIYGKQIHDTSSIASVFNTNDGFKGFRCPMKKKDDGWTLDFDNRYFTEDIPEGFCAYKGMADLVGVETPAIDEILGFFQGFMGKEYLKDGKLAGKDVAETKAPQAYGIDTLEKYLG